jgi:hypothetical protein
MLGHLRVLEAEVIQRRLDAGRRNRIDAHASAGRGPCPTTERSHKKLARVNIIRKEISYHM